MSKDEIKEVYFDKYCKLCEAKDVIETEEPCNTCLGNPVNTNCHRPGSYERRIPCRNKE